MGIFDVGAKWIENFVVNRKDAGKITQLEKDNKTLAKDKKTADATIADLETENAILKAKAQELPLAIKDKPHQIKTAMPGGNSVPEMLRALSHKSSFTDVLKEILRKKSS